MSLYLAVWLEPGGTPLVCMAPEVQDCGDVGAPVGRPGDQHTTPTLLGRHPQHGRHWQYKHTQWPTFTLPVSDARAVFTKCSMSFDRIFIDNNR